MIRPGGTLVEQWGIAYNAKGMVSSGLYILSELMYPCEVEIKESIGFMGMNKNCKYTENKEGLKQIGEHSKENKLHGKGISVNKKGNLYIGYWTNGKL